jgi:hypothetical protein
MTLQDRKKRLIKIIEQLDDEKSILLLESDLQLAARLDPAAELNDDEYAELMEDIADPTADTISETDFWQSVGKWNSK